MSENNPILLKGNLWIVALDDESYWVVPNKMRNDGIIIVYYKGIIKKINCTDYILLCEYQGNLLDYKKGIIKILKGMKCC